MKKISLVIIGFLIIGFSGINNFSLAHTKSGNIMSSDISWSKHIIDDDFDYAFGVYVHDVDNDGDCDVLGAAQEGDFIAWWRNEGGDPISWTKFIIDDNFNGATSVFAVDIDDDLDVDVVGSAWYANEIALWINDGGNPITWIKYVIRTGFDFAHEVYCYDLDEDGDVDILGSSSGNHQIAWWRNDGGDPISWTEQIIGNNFLGAKSARVADMNNDGLLDVIGAAIDDNQICWWKNNGGDPIIWQEYVIVDDFTGAHRAEVCDLDFDGDMDVIGTAIFGDEIAWFRNDGGTPVTWKKQVIAAGFNKACIGLPVDIDEDGDIDVVGTAIYGNDVALFRNDGGEPIEWTKIIIDSSFYGAWPGYVADIDSDDDIDIVAGGSFEDTLAWWESDLSTKSDLGCEGSISKNEVKPGSKVTGTIEIFNMGDPGSLLDWEIADEPSWGTWTIDPISGMDLTPEDGDVTVDIECVVPKKKNQELNGKIKIQNTENVNDYCYIDVKVITLKNKAFIPNFYLLNWLFEQFPNAFPVFRYLVEL